MLGAVDQAIEAAALVQATGCVVCVPEYPRPPWTQFGGSKALEGTEYVPPTEEDGDESPLAVARWVLQQAVFDPETGTRRYGKENVFITGDSAGGNLSLATLLSAAGRGGPGGFEHPYYPALKDEMGQLIAPNVAGLALQSPWVDLRTGPPTGPPNFDLPSAYYPYSAMGVTEQDTIDLLGYANTSVAYFDPARHVMDATKGDYLPIAACAVASELYRTGYPGNLLNGRHNRPPLWGDLEMSGIKTYLTEEEWTGKSILVSPALMTPEDAARALPKKCWMMTGHFEVLKEQQFHLGRAMQSASRLGPPMPVTTMDDETLAPDNSVGSHIVIQAGHDWGVIGVPQEFTPLQILRKSMGNFFLEAMGAMKAVM